ncbi:gephyrin-like molybdotransferase receptor GlpR [Kitasatospora sp. NPDC049258]|uniref:divisome protein SepX/GlpR n=1 Tax=Kitasatospora sp. NPDC049258 TaxID=3155394 RepID=UPI00343EA976
MSSSGLIYAVIVGAWAAYLVPMWLRRQDELNESRPTERFSTAIRLLAGRSAMERRAARTLGDQTETGDGATDAEPGLSRDLDSAPEPDSELSPEAARVDAAGAEEVPPERESEPESESESELPESVSAPAPSASSAGEVRREPGHGQVHGHGAASVERRARLLARRRRMVTALFFAFALGAVAAAVAGVAFIWVPMVPALLLTLYIGHLRRLERQRFEVKLDRARAAQAAERLRARERERQRAEAEADRAAARHDEAHAADPGRPHLRLAAEPGGHEAGDGREARASREGREIRGDRRGQRVRTESATTAVAEATEHEEWVDGMRERGAAGPDSWEPVPVPLPTYVTAPVAPRVTRSLDLGAPGTWDSGRTTADARNTPLFDQYAEHGPPPAEAECQPRLRAANE